jgi:hypothetical protein
MYEHECYIYMYIDTHNNIVRCYSGYVWHHFIWFSVFSRVMQ